MYDALMPVSAKSQTLAQDDALPMFGDEEPSSACRRQ
jgi:hypothetical protein